MASFNKVILLGNVGQDPETRYLPSGDAVTSISLATSETWKDKTSGERKESTEWWKVVFFGRLAEVAGEYLKKGSPVLIEGKGRTETWEKDGVKHYRFTVRADQMRLLGSKSDGQHTDDRQQGKSDEPRRAPPAQKTGGKFDDMDDDIPF